MPVPYKPIDMDEVIRKINAVSSEEWSQHYAQAVQLGLEEWLQWLAQYDITGRLKPEFQDLTKQIRIRTYGFLSLSPEEKSQFVVSEKKRLCVL